MLYEKLLDTNLVSFTNTENLSREQWLKLRTKGIGGSDAGAIMGLNKYATPLSVYLAKKDEVAFLGNEATKWGNILEDPVRQTTKQELNIQIEKVPGMFTSKQNHFMNANLDGLVFAETEKDICGEKVFGLGGHEIKTSKTGDGFSKDEIPDSYYAQVQHYMAVTGLKFFILTVFIFESYKLSHYVVKRNEKFIADLIQAESIFWNENINKNNPPAPTGNENESDLVKSLSVAKTLELPCEYESLLEEKTKLDEQIADLKKQSESLKETVLLKLHELSNGEESEKTTVSCGSWKITYNKQTRKTVDTEALKKAGIYETYTKESTTKVLRITAPRGEK